MFSTSRTNKGTETIRINERAQFIASHRSRNMYHSIRSSNKKVTAQAAAISSKKKTTRFTKHTRSKKARVRARATVEGESGDDLDRLFTEISDYYVDKRMKELGAPDDDAGDFELKSKREDSVIRKHNLYKMLIQARQLKSKEIAWGEENMQNVEQLNHRLHMLRMEVNNGYSDSNFEARRACSQKIRMIHTMIDFNMYMLVIDSAHERGWRIFLDPYNGLSNPNVGNGGEVWSCCRVTDNAQSAEQCTYVVKIITRDSPWSFDKEVKLCKRISKLTPDLTGVYDDSWTTPAASCIVMRRVGHMSANIYLDSVLTNLQIEQFWRGWNQIIRMLIDNFISHGDLHERNILVDSNPDGYLRMYVIDFGQSQEMPHTEQARMLLVKEYRRYTDHMQEKIEKTQEAAAAARPPLLESRV